MKKTLAAITLFLVLVGIGIAVVPPPSANQLVGIYDTKVVNLNEPECRGCHTSGVPDRHHNLVPTGEYYCMNCHPIFTGPNGEEVTMDRACQNCHNGTAWYANPAEVNVSRPHHINTVEAQNRDCKACHSSLIANYNDGHYIPTYAKSLVTPVTHYKIYNATSGRYWGGCYACHQEDAGVTPELFDQHDTHHQAILGDRFGTGHQRDRTAGAECNWCHTVNATGRPLGYPDPLNMEIRNSSWLTDPANLTGCEQCHDVATLHNIQYDYANTNGQLGFGHIGANWDCNGCHAFWDAGAAPYQGAIVPNVVSITPAKLVTGVETVVTITGTDFLSGSGTYTAEVSVDGTLLTPDSVTDKQIVVTVPGLEAGLHTMKVVKNGDTTPKYSKLGSLVVVTPTDVTSAVLARGKITITGTGFGAQPDPAFKDLGVFVEHTEGKGKDKVTVTVKADIVSWTDTEIVAQADASPGELLTVKSLNGEDSTVIAGGGGKPPK